MSEKKTWGNIKLATIASFIMPALLVIGLLYLMIALRDGAESAMARLTVLLPVGYAFSAGMVASVNPCGFMLLPSYILYHLGIEKTNFYEQSTQTRVLKALYLGGVATLGIVAVFTLTGSIVAAGGYWLNAVFPYARAVIGVGMIVLGAWLVITGKSLGLMIASRVAITPQRNVGNVFLYGIVYAIGSLSCTLPIFLVVVGGALSSQEWGNAVSQFVGYSLGMALVFIIVTVGAALVRQAIVQKLRNTVRYVHRFSALLLIGAGGYLVYDWIALAAPK